MAHSFSELASLSDEALVREYDASAVSTQVGLGFYRDELMRRAFDRQSVRVERMTRWMTWMTAAILALTVVNVILVWRTIPK